MRLCICVRDFLLFTPVSVVLMAGDFSFVIMVFFGFIVGFCVVLIGSFIVDSFIGDNVVGVTVPLMLFASACIVVVFGIIEDSGNTVFVNGDAISNVGITSCAIVAVVDDVMDGTSAECPGTIFVDESITTCDVIDNISVVILCTASRLVDPTWVVEIFVNT